MDINLGQITLTQNQISRLGSLNGSLSGNVRGLCYHSDTRELVVTTNMQPDIAAILALVNALPDTPLPALFDVVAFQTALAQLLLTGGLSNVNLRFEFAAIIAYVSIKDFAGLYQYAQWLIGQGIATADDLMAINNVCKVQGIDLTNLGGN
jgi:hypothetical protein